MSVRRPKREPTKDCHTDNQEEESEFRRRRPRLTTLRSLSVQHNITRILSYLYVGGDDCVDDKTALNHIEASHIVNCTIDTPNYFQDEKKYLRIALEDSLDAAIEKEFDRALHFIEEARIGNGVCLVHCSHGMSRSATIVLAYLIEFNNMSLQEALEFTRKLRPVTSPNTGFMKKLIDFEVTRNGKATIDLEKYQDNRFADVYSLMPLSKDEPIQSDEL